MTFLKRSAVALLATTALATIASSAIAQEIKGKSAGDIIVRARALAVIPDESAKITADALGGRDTGLRGRVDNDYIPELDFTYFVTDNIALELIAGTTRHKITADGNLLGGAYVSADVGKVRLLPPTLTLQYHFLPKSQISPYAGAGLNWTLFYDEQAATGFTNLSLKNRFGFALQAGVDFFVTDNVLINFDVKKLWLGTDLKVTSPALGTTLRSKVDLDPWIIGVGVGYKF